MCFPDSKSDSGLDTMSAHRILVIDDEAHIVQVLSLKLRNAGYEVITAADGEEGYELVLKHRPELIITDFQMPYVTGLELCRMLAAHEAASGEAAPPVLMLTARGYALDPEDLEIGSDGPSRRPIIRDVLSKPFSPRAIVEQIQRILAESTANASGRQPNPPPPRPENINRDQQQESSLGPGAWPASRGTQPTMKKEAA